MKLKIFEANNSIHCELWIECFWKINSSLRLESPGAAYSQVRLISQIIRYCSFNYILAPSNHPLPLACRNLCYPFSHLCLQLCLPIWVRTIPHPTALLLHWQGAVQIQEEERPLLFNSTCFSPVHIRHLAPSTIAMMLGLPGDLSCLQKSHLFWLHSQFISISRGCKCLSLGAEAEAMSLIFSAL